MYDTTVPSGHETLNAGARRLLSDATANSKFYMESHKRSHVASSTSYTTPTQLEWQTVRKDSIGRINLAQCGLHLTHQLGDKINLLLHVPCSVIALSQFDYSRPPRGVQYHACAFRTAPSQVVGIKLLTA